MRARCSVVLVLLIGSPVLADSRLSSADTKYLDSLMPSALFDPVAAERVRVKVACGSVFRPVGKDLHPQSGWLVRGQAGAQDRVYFTDGFGIPAPPADRIERIDFLKQATAFFGAVQPPGTDTADWVRKTAADVYGEASPFLALAAWYHRLGHDDHAAAALDIARAFEEDPLEALRSRLAVEAFGAVGGPFRDGDDAAAAAVGEHYLRRYTDFAPDLADEVRDVVTDARRRLRLGRLGSGPVQTRTEPGLTGPPARRLAELIEALDEVADSPGRRFRGWWGREEHVLVVRLANLGEAAVPALIDVLEHDRRLTRVMRPQLGCCGRGRRVGLDLIPVRELAEDALTTILQLNEFPPAPDETDDMTGWVRTARRMRHYWAGYGPLTPDDRMMRFLTDPAVPADLALQAARNLVRPAGRGNSGWQPDPAEDRRLDFGDEDRRPDRAVRASGLPSRHPLIARYTRPTVAAAILAAADREWAELTGQKASPAHLRYWSGREEAYLDTLVELGDERIGPELARRATATTDPDIRRKYARAAFALGTTTAWRQFARDVARGTVSLDSGATAGASDDSRTSAEWQHLAETILQCPGPDSELALWAMADRRHPFAPVLLSAVRVYHRSPDFPHPFYLTPLRRQLSDLTPTGATYELKNGSVRSSNGYSFPTEEKSEWEADLILPEAEDRECDEPGHHLSMRLVGAPFYHPLRKDADVQLVRLMDFFDTYAGRLRLATGPECAALRVSGNAPFIPDVKPLGRPATAADVKAGAAVFHQDGRGRAWTGAVPKQVTLKADAKRKPQAGLVVQAEADADGKVVFGVIFRHEVRKVRADEVAP